MRLGNLYVSVVLALGLVACGQGTVIFGPDVVVSGPPEVVNLTQLTPPPSPIALHGPITTNLNDLQMG